MRFLLYLYKCSCCGFIHCMWWWLRIQYFQLDFSHLVGEALSLCSCTFVHLDIVDFDVKLFYYDSWWLILCFLYSCSWLLVCFWRFCAACDVVENVYLIILKSNVQLFLPRQLSISFAKLSALVNSFFWYRRTEISYVENSELIPIFIWNFKDLFYNFTCIFPLVNS